MEDQKVRKVIVTGSNRGIGFQIAKQLSQLPSAYHIIIACRDETKGKEAVESIKSDTSIKSTVEFHKLDIQDSNSINDFADWIAKDHKEFDVLVNNAGGGWLKNTAEDGVFYLRTNFLGGVELTEKLLPLLASDGKVLNVTSESGCLWVQRFAVKEALTDPKTTRQSLMELCDEYKKRTIAKTYCQVGWFEQHYYNSKCLMNAYTRWVLPGLLKGDQSCYAMDPGFCQTDLCPEGPLPVEEGAKTPLYIIQLPFKNNAEYNGKFFMESKVSDW